MERSLFRQRIVGGLVLVALGAIVVPFLLDMHQEDQWWGKGNIPDKPEDGFITRVLPLQEWSQQAQSELKQAGAQLEGAAAAIKDQAEVPPVARPEAHQAPKVVSTPSASPAATVDAEAWVVQLGSFANPKNADDLYRRLREQGYPAFVDRLQHAGRAAYRVRIGPESQRAAAETLRDRLERELKLKGMVLHVP